MKCFLLLPTSFNMNAFLFWGFSLLFYFYENLLQVFPSIIKPELSETFHLNSEAFGNLTALCFYAYGLMQIPVGILVDRFGSRAMIITACGLSATGCLLFGSAEMLWMAQIGRVLMGIGGAFAFISCMKIAITYFATRWITLLLGITVTVGFLGALSGLSLFAQYIENMNWRCIILCCGILGFVLSGLIWIFTRNLVFTIKDDSKRSATKKWEGTIYLTQRKTTWIAAFYGCFMFVPTQVFGASWGVSFLYEAHGLERSLAGLSCALLYAGWIIGAPLWGWLSSYYKKYYSIMGMTTLLTLVFSFVLIYVHPLSTLSMMILLFGVGLCSSAYLLVFMIIQYLTPSRFSGTAFGILNSINSLSAFADPLAGYILDRELGISSILQYQFAFLLVPILLLSALPLLFYLAVLENNETTNAMILELESE